MTIIQRNRVEMSGHLRQTSLFAPFGYELMNVWMKQLCRYKKPEYKAPTEVLEEKWGKGRD